jgi:hypothetical protein
MHTMAVDDARRRHDESAAALRKGTERLIGMCTLKLLDAESIQDQACVVAGLVCSEYDTRVQLDMAEKAAKQESAQREGKG